MSEIESKNVLRCIGKIKEKYKSLSSPALLRLIHDLSDLDIPKNCEILITDNPYIFEIIVAPSVYFLEKVKIVFELITSKDYPLISPKIVCKTPIFHPNITYEGVVCMNILRLDWMPIYDMNTIIHGILNMIEFPDFNDCLNRDAGEILKNNKSKFEMLCKQSVFGLTFNEKFYRGCQNLKSCTSHDFIKK